MTEGSSTGSHSRDAVAAVGVADDPLPVCPSGAHPVSMGIIVRKNPAMIEVRRRGAHRVFAALARKGNCCLVNGVRICAIRIDKVALMDVRATSRLMSDKKLNMLDVRAKHVPWNHGVSP